MKVKTNNHWREIKHSQDDEARAYFTYKGQDWYLDEFMRLNGMGEPYVNYDGYLNLTAFSAILVKLSRCGSAVKVAYCYS